MTIQSYYTETRPLIQGPTDAYSMSRSRSRTYYPPKQSGKDSKSTISKVVSKMLKKKCKKKCLPMPPIPINLRCCDSQPPEVEPPPYTCCNTCWNTCYWDTGCAPCVDQTTNCCNASCEEIAAMELNEKMDTKCCKKIANKLCDKIGKKCSEKIRNICGDHIGRKCCDKIVGICGDQNGRKCCEKITICGDQASRQSCGKTAILCGEDIGTDCSCGIAKICGNKIARNCSDNITICGDDIGSNNCRYRKCCDTTICSSKTCCEQTITPSSSKKISIKCCNNNVGVENPAPSASEISRVMTHIKSTTTGLFPPSSSPKENKKKPSKLKKKSPQLLRAEQSGALKRRSTSMRNAASCWHQNPFAIFIMGVLTSSLVLVLIGFLTGGISARPDYPNQHHHTRGMYYIRKR